MPILSATTIGSLSPNAQSIWRAQQNVSRRKILVVREEDFPTTSIFNGQSFNNYFGQAWRNTASQDSTDIFDLSDRASTFFSGLWTYVKNKLNEDKDISYVLYDFPSVTGMILEDNFADERVNGSGINLIEIINGNFFTSFKNWLPGQLLVPREIKISMAGIPIVSRWSTSDNGATYSRISSRSLENVSSEISNKFISPLETRWQSVTDLMSISVNNNLAASCDFITIDGRDFSSWDDGEIDLDRLDYSKLISYISKSLPAPIGPIGSEKEILCLISDHEFIPPFRRARFPAISKDYRVRSAVAAKEQFRDPPTTRFRSFVYYDFSKISSVPRFVTWSGNNLTQTRAGSFGIDNPDTFNGWKDFILNHVKPWYIWGHRRFWLNFPFGRPNQLGTPGSINASESGINQMDAWIAAKHGQTIDGLKVNDPMPWLTSDFVSVWHYMTTGMPLSSSPEIFNLNRHQSIDLSQDPLFGWFDPSDPIEAVGYAGSPINHITDLHPNAMDRINSMDPDRFQIFINDCYEPFLWSGMSLGFDKASMGPQSWPGKSLATNELSSHNCACLQRDDMPKCFMKDNLQAVWYRWIADLARRHPKRVYIGGIPKKMPVIDPLVPARDSELGYLDNDYKLFSFVTDDYDFISLTNDPIINNAHGRDEYVSRKQEVVRYSLNDFIPVDIANQGRSATPLEFSSLLSDSSGENLPIEPPGGVIINGNSIIRYYKTDNDNSGSLSDSWKIFYCRHVIMKNRSLPGHTIQPLYSSFIESNKLNTINSILLSYGLPQNISGYASWLTSNVAMGTSPTSTTANNLVFYPRIIKTMFSRGSIVSDHEQVVDSILPALSGCVDGLILDSLSTLGVNKAFSADIFDNSDDYGILFGSRRIIKYDFFKDRIAENQIVWNGSDSIDEKAQVSEFIDENVLTTIISISNPSYSGCPCERAGVLPEEVAFSSSSSSSSSSMILSSSSTSQSPPPVSPSNFKDYFYSLVMLRGQQFDDLYYKWNYMPNVSMFVGKPEPNGFSSFATRAFKWECDPFNPNISSPWHNYLYEYIIDAYQWGSRSFEIFQPFGDYDNNPVHPSINRDTSLPDDYLIGSSFLTLKFWENTFINIPDGLVSPDDFIIPVGGTGPQKERLDLLSACPCRWKGFKQAIRSIIEGNLSPDPATGRPPIDEPCRISFYLPGLRGFGGYRYRSNLWWDKYFNESKSENPSSPFHVHASYADGKFYEDLDYIVQQFVEMKGTIPGTENNLSISIDIGSGCATPSNVFLWAPSWMIAGGSIPTYQANVDAMGPEDGQPDYRTEALELADWYVVNRFKQFGIQANIETRPEKFSKKSRVFNTTDSGIKFPNLINPRTNSSVPNGDPTTSSERPFNPNGDPVTGEFGWYDGWSNQEICAIDSTFSNYENGNRIIGFFTPLSEIPFYHKLSFSNVYPPYDVSTPNPAVRWTSDLYGDRKTLTYQGVTVNIRDLHPSTDYGPYWFLWQLYPIVDTYRYAYNQINNTGEIIPGVVYDIPQTVVYEAMHFRNGLFALSIFDGVQSPLFQYWRLPDSFFNPNEIWMGSQRMFDGDKFLSNPLGYTGGLWTVEGRNFWNNNIRSESFDKFISMLHSVTMNGAPKGAEQQGWTGDIYPNDFYSKNVISSTLFGAQETPPIASTPIIARQDLPWFQSSDISLQYQFSAFDAVLFCEQYVYKIPGAQQGGTPPFNYQSPLSFCALKDMIPGCASTIDDGPFYKTWQLTGSLPAGWTFGSANATTLTQLRLDFAERIGIDRTIRAMSLSGPDMIVVFIKGGGEPLWWNTQIPGLRQFPLFADDGTGADAVGLAIDIIQDYKNASNKYRCKLVGYFFPFSWIELNETDYPVAKDIINRNVKEGRHGPYVSFRSIFKNGNINMDYVNHLVNVHVELAQIGMDQETGYGFRGVHWDAMPVYYTLDFTPAAKAASGIDTSVDFPFPVAEGTPLYNYLIPGSTVPRPYGEYNGNVASLIFRPLRPEVGWTQAVRDKLEKYIYAIRRKEAEFVRLVREGIDAAGFTDFLILPAVISSVYSFELPMNSEYMLPFTNGQKTEIGIESYRRRRQPANISTPFGIDALPDWWLGLYHDLLSINGNNGKRTLAWQIGPWIQPTSMRYGNNCDSTYADCLQNLDTLYGNPSQLGFYYGISLGVLPRDVAVRGWLENQSLLCLASHTTIEFMYGFYDWSQYDAPHLLSDFENTANSFAVQHLPFMRKISSVLRSISDCKIKLSNRSNATWCLIMTRNEYLWKQGIYPPGNVPTEYAKIWPIIGALLTCIENGVPHTIVHDETFKASNYDNAPILLVPIPASELPLEVQRQIEQFSGKVIFMEEEYIGPSPRLENNFHNTTIDASTGKTRAQISREKLWNLMISDGTPISVQTAIEIPSFLPEKPCPLASYEIGQDHFGNSSLNIILMADASWHDNRKHAFYIDWHNGPNYSFNGLCARQNLLYTQPVVEGGSTPVLVENGGYRRVLDGCPCPDGFNRDCYFIEYTNSGTIPIEFFPARGKLTFYAGYPPVWGNNRNVSVIFNARQKPHRIRQLLLNHSKGYFDPIDMYVQGNAFDGISFEQGSYINVQLKEPTYGLQHAGICVAKTSLQISNTDDYVAFLENTASLIPSNVYIDMKMRCSGRNISRPVPAANLFIEMAADAISHPDDYLWISQNDSCLITPSDYWPIGFAEPENSPCRSTDISIAGVVFQGAGICTIAKRIPSISNDADGFNIPTCTCANDVIMSRVDRVPASKDALGSERWEPLIEAPLFRKSDFANGSFLVIKPISDNTSNFFNVDVNGLPIAKGILSYIRSINNDIEIFTDNQKNIADLYSGIILDFPDPFDLAQDGVHPKYCSLPHTVNNAQANGYMEGRRDVADVNGTFIKVMSKIRLEFPGTRVSVRWLGSFGDGTAIQEDKDNSTSNSILNPTVDTRKGLQQRISESYGPLLEAVDFIPVENNHATALESSVTNTSISYMRNHFLERNSASSSMYRSAERKPIFVSTWMPTDHTVWTGGQNPPTIVQGPTGEIVYKNVNLYQYVKPMIALQDCANDGGYEHTSATHFTTGAGCSGRFTGIAEKIMELPEGMRTIHMVRYNQADMFNPITSLFTPDTFADGTASPFAVNETQFIYEDFSTVANALKALGVVPDYLSLDCEQGGHFSNWGLGSTVTATQMQNIYDSPLFQQSWFDMPSPAYMFNYNGKFSNTINAVKNGPYHPQDSRSYLYWNQVVRAMHAQMLNKSIVRVADEVWGLKNVSNYVGYHIREWDPFYDYQGHSDFGSCIVGNAQSIELYAAFVSTGVYKILDADPTKIVRTNASGQGSGTVIDSSVADSWFQLLILIHKIRCVHRGAPNMPIRPWIAPKEFVDAGAGFNARWTTDSYGPGLYNESIRHFCLSGVEMFNYWNTFDNTTTRLQQNLTNLNNIITDVNTRLGGWTLQVLVAKKINFKANYIISGAVTADGLYLWRVTPKPGITLKDESNNTLTVDIDGGAWITRAIPAEPLFT